MESKNICYCLNPQCLHFSSRVFLKQQFSYLHSSCRQWVVSQSQFLHFSKGNLPFDLNFPLSFSSNPFQTQAYLYFNKSEITEYLTTFVQAIRSQLATIMKEFEEMLSVTLSTMFSFRKYQEISSLAKIQTLEPEIKSAQLANILTKSLPMYGDMSLPQLETAKSILEALRNQLQSLLDIKGEQSKNNPNIVYDTKLEYFPEVKFLKLEDIETQKTSNFSQVSPSQHYTKQERIIEDEKKVITREENQLVELWEYIMKSCNLNTATKLMGEPLQKFYQNGGDGKQSTVRCCYCEFKVTIKTKSKVQNNSACSYAILQHLYKEHTSSILYYFNILKGKYTNNTLSTLLQKIGSQQVKSVTVIDSAALFDTKKLCVQDNTFSFELVYGGNKPMFKKQYMKGGNSKEISILLGFFICYCSCILKKKIWIYTSVSRCEIINKFCEFYGIVDVRTVPGSYTASEGTEIIKKEMAIPIIKDTMIKS